MDNKVSLTIDGFPVTVPTGTLIVNAAKQIGIDIPLFCYHPKMEPVGMCRMCLVEVGRPVIDRNTGQVVREADNKPRIQFGAKLETACTTPVSEGMIVRSNTSEKAMAGRKDIIEFLLTSHPLDCPVCDKGGECPLQNQTMAYGPGESRYLYDEKKHLAKHVALGELIYLDRERCIQCGRCVRFQELIADDPVIGFSQRGRSIEIISSSDPGFASYFSGNTTDICPVGALTTADFRFRARPWELMSAASICSQCAVGCNLTFNVRREAITGGNVVIKRVMPRQNELVNEMWICDKGRFGYHYTDRENRLLTPLLRKDKDPEHAGELQPASWDEALNLVADRLKTAGKGVLTLVSGRLSNEDLFNLKQLTDALGGQAVLDTPLAGGDLVSQVGFSPGTNFASMGAETAILVVACDLEEEAPLWWLRVKQAAQRGAKLIVANPRPTKLERYAQSTLRYPYGSEAATVLALVNSLSAKRPNLPISVQMLLRSQELQSTAQVIANAENAVVIYGSEGSGLKASRALAQACANLLIVTGHTGRANNGLLGVWQRANDQGAWDMGFRPVEDLDTALNTARVLYLAGVDPAGDNPALLRSPISDSADQFIIVQELTLTATARLADVVLPVQAYTEREGSYTSGERRVQRFYPAVPDPPHSLPDFAVTGQIARRLGMDLAVNRPARAFMNLAAQIPAYASLTYQQLAQVVEQFPIVGRNGLYYGGTSYENRQGLGVQLPIIQVETPLLGWIQPEDLQLPSEGLLAVPITRLYDLGTTLRPSKVLQTRLPKPFVLAHPADLPGENDDASSTKPSWAHLRGDNVDAVVRIFADPTVPRGMLLVPRSLGIPITHPTSVQIEAISLESIQSERNSGQ